MEIYNKYKDIITELDQLLELKKIINSAEGNDGEKMLNEVLIDMRIDEIHNNIIYLRKNEISMINSDKLNANELYPHVFNIKRDKMNKKKVK